MNYTVYSKDGKELRTIELSDAVFGLPVNDDLNEETLGVLNDLLNAIYEETDVVLETGYRILLEKLNISGETEE